MSWSLKLQDGDFSLSGSKLATVTNEDKLLQDIRCAVLEPMGTDDLHPSFGSLIDGGVTPDGISVPSLIGNDDLQTAAGKVSSEIQRIVRDYQSQQLARAKQDRITYGRASLTPGEVLVSIQDLTLTQNADALQVNVVFTNARGQTLTAALDIST